MDVVAKIIRVAIYIRVSHEEQAKHGLSLDAQIRTLKKYAQEHGWKIVDVYADEGITARKKLSKRKEFQRLMGDVKDDKIDMIIFIKLDRWFRNVPDYYKTQEILDAHNVQWEATEEEYDTTTANGRLHLNIKLSIAQNESDQTSDRIKFVFENRVKDGFVVSGSKKMGYDIIDKRHVINQEESEYLNYLYDYCLKCGSVRHTLFHYNETHDDQICYDTMRKWLTDSSYIGLYVNSHGEVIEGFTPRIMTDEKFYAVQKVINKRIKTEKGTEQNPETLFDGLLYCPHCEHKFSRKICHVKNKKTPPRTYIYYACWKSKKVFDDRMVYQCDNSKETREDFIENYLLENFKKLAENYIVENTITEKPKPKKKKDNSANIKKKIEKLQTLFIENLIELDEYKSRYEVLKQELEKNQNELNSKENQPKDLSKIKKILNEDIQTMYDSLDKKDKKRFWLNTIDKIYVEHGEVVKVAFL